MPQFNINKLCMNSLPYNNCFNHSAMKLNSFSNRDAISSLLIYFLTTQAHS